VLQVEPSPERNPPLHPTARLKQAQTRLDTAQIHSPASHGTVYRVPGTTMPPRSPGTTEP
jgi:hypothetical protein